MQVPGSETSVHQLVDWLQNIKKEKKVHVKNSPNEYYIFSNIFTPFFVFWYIWCAWASQGKLAFICEKIHLIFSDWSVPKVAYHFNSKQSFLQQSKQNNIWKSFSCIVCGVNVLQNVGYHFNSYMCTFTSKTRRWAYILGLCKTVSLSIWTSAQCRETFYTRFVWFEWVNIYRYRRLFSHVFTLVLS